MVMYQAKAWIDMFGYRLFKALGALIIIGLSQWSLAGNGVVDLGWVVLAGCGLWAWVLTTLNREYLSLTHPAGKQPALQGAHQQSSSEQTVETGPGH
jgi:AAA family ATP:ADP antiporter